MLDESAPEGVPTDLVLRTGAGTALDRALIFLDMLSQLEIDGCLIACPDKEGKARFWLAGALVDKEIFLFDTRWEFPCPV